MTGMTEAPAPEAIIPTAEERPYTVSIVTHGVNEDGLDDLKGFVYTLNTNTPTNASMYAQALCVRECAEDNIEWQCMFVVSIFVGDHEALETRDSGSLLPDQVEENGDICFYSVDDKPIDLDPEAENKGETSLLDF